MAVEKPFDGGAVGLRRAAAKIPNEDSLQKVTHVPL
jgi:hypothetical protein